MDLLMFCICVVVSCMSLPLLMYKSQTYEQMQAEKKQFADQLFGSKPKKNPKKAIRKVNNKKGKAKVSKQMDRKAQEQKSDNDGHSDNASGELDNNPVHSSDKVHAEFKDADDSQRKVQTIIDVLDKVNLTNGKIQMLVNYLLNQQPTIIVNESNAIVQMLNQQLEYKERELAEERNKFLELSAEIIRERTNSQNEIGRLTDELYAKNSMIQMILEDQKQQHQAIDQISSKMNIVNELLERLQGEAANKSGGDKENAASACDEMSQQQQQQ